MLKTHKKQIILSSLCVLLPILIGLLLWDRLPNQMATHWGVNGEPDGWSSKAFGVFATPLLLLGAHWLIIGALCLDARNKTQSPKALFLVFWIMPAVSAYTAIMLYGTALDWKLNVSSVAFGLVGLLFLVTGNYMPKMKQNATLGLRLPWTLESEENWNAAHRFAGRLWVGCGGVVLVMAFFPAGWSVVTAMVLIAATTLGSAVYSWLYARKQRQNTHPLD